MRGSDVPVSKHLESSEERPLTRTFTSVELSPLPLVYQIMIASPKMDA